MPTSKRRQIANAKNAKKSTGPRTAKGKARSSRNALKHGLLAKSVLLQAKGADEKQKDFDALLRDLVKDLKPRNMVEETLVERIATCYWRLRRAHRFEGRAIDAALEAPDPHQPEIDDLQERYDKQNTALKIELRLLQLLDSPTEKRSPAQKSELQSSLNDFARTYAIESTDESESDLEIRVRTKLPDLVEILKIQTDLLQRKLRTAQSKRPQTPHNSYATPLATDMLLKIVRYETMLDRQIHRAMVELRRLRNSSNQNMPDE